MRGYVAHPIRQGNAIVLQSQDCLSMRNDKNQPMAGLYWIALIKKYFLQFFTRKDISKDIFIITPLKCA